VIQEQQRIFLRKSNLETEKGKPNFYLLQLPSDKIASICVMHLMKTLFRQFIRDQSDDSHKTDHGNFDISVDFSSDNVKTPAITLFSDLGDLFAKELKSHIMSSKRRGGITDKIEKHHMIEDNDIGSIPKDVQLKIGAFLTNVMCKNLTYSVGKKKHLLLKAQVLKKSKNKELGYVLFNKSFIEHFVSEIDKVHDLNIHIERSLPMIYKPAPWKNFKFGAYYLKQTKMVKIIASFKEANSLLNQGDISDVCNALNVVSDIKWRVNKNVLEMIEYIWSIGGGLGEIPKRFNDRPITAELLRKAQFKDKLKLIKEHQKNMETHALRCEFLLRLNIAQSFKNVN
jgi:DNA-directed RNA polymerase